MPEPPAPVASVESLPMQTDALPDLAALIVFAAIGAFTPGPNTALSLATGARFGWRRVGPHALGVALGFGTMCLLAALGAVGIVLADPRAMGVLRIAGVVWMLWLAWKVSLGGRAGGAGLDRPLAAWQSATLQWVNPKAWMLALAVAATWAGAVRLSPWLATVPALVLAGMTVPANLAWAVLGHSMQRWLGIGRRQVWFDRSMGLALALSALAMLR